MRKFTEGTILSYIEKLVLKDKIKRADLSRILTSSLKNAFAEIHAVFHELNTDKLSPVFEKFNGRYSYEDLRIARIFLDKEY